MVVCLNIMNRNSNDEVQSFNSCKDDFIDDENDLDFMADGRMLQQHPVQSKSAREKCPRKFDGFVTYLAHNNIFDPITVKQALSSKDAEQWKLAMKDEIDSLDENDTWSFG